MSSVFASSHFVLALLMGVSVCMGLLHLWQWRGGRGDGCHGWLAQFCAVSLVFLVGRDLELGSRDLETAVGAGRIQAAAGAFLIFSLLGFGRALRRMRFDVRFHGSLLLVTAVLCAAGLLGDFLVLETGFVDEDWLGRRHHVPDAGPGLPWLGVYGLAACLLLGLEVRRSSRLSSLEQGVSKGGIAIAAALGGGALARAFGLVELPNLVEFGPVSMAAGLSYLLVHESGRKQVELERLVGERTRQRDEASSRYRLLVDNAPLGIFAIDREGRALAANRHWLQLLGIPEEGRQEAPAAGLDVLGAEATARSGLGQSLRACLENGRAFVGEFAFEGEGGASREWRIDAAPIRDARDVIVGVQGIAEEVGERKQLEERLRQSRTREAIGGLAADIARELNNPLSYVRANLAMLHEEWEGLSKRLLWGREPASESLGQCREMLDDALEGVERAVAVVREVSEFSHAEGEPFGEVDLDDLIEDSLRAAAPQLRPGIEIERRTQRLPPVPGSPGQLRQVFLNLIVNAIHALREDGEGTGHIVIETRHQPAESEVVVRIQDDGPGIAEDRLDRLFEPFSTNQATGKGTGLGLYVCYEIVRMHEGRISVETGPRSGTCFAVHLPTRS